MTNIEAMIKALRLAWIPRLIQNNHPSWKSIPDHLFKKYGGLLFLLSCNYHVNDFEDIPSFYKDILLYFYELKNLYGCQQGRNTILFNNRNIRIDGKTFFWTEWYKKGIRTIRDLLGDNGQILPFPVFQSKYSLQKTTFLHYYQVVSAIPSHLLTEAKIQEFNSETINIEDPESFRLDENVTINLLKANCKDFYWLIIDRKYNDEQTGPKGWNKTIPMEKTNWKKIFKSVPKTCRENRLREFNFKFIHRIVVTKKELFRFNIKSDSNCIYCREPDSIDHTFLECQFTKSFNKDVLQWFNVENNCNFNLNTEDFLFGVSSVSSVPTKKLNYTLLFLRYYIYKKKLQNDSPLLLLPDFIKKMKYKYKIENIS